MVRLLGKAIAALALVSILDFALAADPAPLCIDMASTIAGSHKACIADNKCAAERPAIGRNIHTKTNDRQGELAPLLDDRNVPDRAAVVTTADQRFLDNPSCNRPQSPTEIVTHLQIAAISRSGITRS